MRKLERPKRREAGDEYVSDDTVEEESDDDDASDNKGVREAGEEGDDVPVVPKKKILTL